MMVRDAAGCILSPVEQARIGRIAPTAERARRAAAHTLERLTLARLLGEEAAMACCGGTAPPGVAGRPWIGLTLAHGGAWVAVGRGIGCAVGVDVEREPDDGA